MRLLLLLLLVGGAATESTAASMDEWEGTYAFFRDDTDTITFDTHDRLTMHWPSAECLHTPIRVIDLTELHFVFEVSANTKCGLSGQIVRFGRSTHESLSSAFEISVFRSFDDLKLNRHRFFGGMVKKRNGV